MKLPVFSTFGNALAFALGSFLTCLRLAWLPITLLLVAQQVVQWLLFEDMMSHMPVLEVSGKDNPVAAFQMILAIWQQMAPIQLAFMFLQALVIAAVAVSIHRVILFGDRREQMLPYLPLVYVVLLLAYTFVVSFSIALISYSYKALKGFGAAEPIPA